MVKVAILHEGNSKKSSDYEILKLLIKELELDEKRVEFFGFGTKSNFFKIEETKYKRLKLLIEEEQINKVLFVLDADYKMNDDIYGGFENTEKELKKIIEELNISNNSDIYITRDPKTNHGYLESLILSSIPKKQKECIETFLKCSEFKSKKNDKAILNQIYKNAYPNAPFNFAHENFDELKEKLKKLFN